MAWRAEPLLRIAQLRELLALPESSSVDDVAEALRRMPPCDHVAAGFSLCFACRTCQTHGLAVVLAGHAVRLRLRWADDLPREW